MTYLNQQQREQLLNDLKNMKFNKAKGKLIRMDPKGRLVYFRNFQATGKWTTRFDLIGLGTRVTLVETNAVNERDGKFKSDYVFEEVIVEPLADNRT